MSEAGCRVMFSAVHKSPGGIVLSPDRSKAARARTRTTRAARLPKRAARGSSGARERTLAPSPTMTRRSAVVGGMGW